MKAPLVAYIETICSLRHVLRLPMLGIKMTANLEPKQGYLGVSRYTFPEQNSSRTIPPSVEAETIPKNTS